MMRVDLECDETLFVQVVDDPLHILTIGAEVASKPRNRLRTFGVCDGAEDLPSGARQPKTRRQPIADRQKSAAEPEQVEHEIGQGLGGLTRARTCAGPAREGKSRTPSMYADEKSDEVVVPRRRPNKGRQLPAEVVEGRASPEGNSRQAAVVRTLSRDTTSIRLAAARRIAGGFKTMCRRRSTRGKRSYAGAAGGVIPVRCNPTTKAHRRA